MASIGPRALIRRYSLITRTVSCSRAHEQRDEAMALQLASGRFSCVLARAMVPQTSPYVPGPVPVAGRRPTPVFQEEGDHHE